MPCLKALKIGFTVIDEQLTWSAGSASVESSVNWLDSPRQLARWVRIKRCRRGRSDDQMLLSLIHSFCVWGCCLNDVNNLGCDQAAWRISGLKT